MVRHMFPCQWPFFILLTLWVTPAHADVFDDVPEAAGYELVYSLDIPINGGFLENDVPYQMDNRAAWEGNFDRIAYYLTLQRPNEGRRYVFVSGRTFTESGAELGLPVSGSHLFYQGPFEDMTVVSNVPGVIQGARLEGGHVEMWEWNYGPMNQAGVPGASSEVFDFGDMPLPGEGMYGSFQVHNVAAGQTIFAYNRWNDESPSDLGIGTNVAPLPDGVVNGDWTFSGNAGAYSLRRLHVLVRPGEPPPPPVMNLTSPQPCQVFQRQRGDVARVLVQGRLLGIGDRVEVRFLPTQGGVPTDWTLLDDTVRDGFFSGRVQIRSGYYRLELRAMNEGEVVGRHDVESIGVGEVFIIAGQSNSANHGMPTLIPNDPRVCTTDGVDWRPALDPLPIATGTGGSPWPAFGDLFAERYNVPVGIMSVGWGGTRVDQWIPGASANLFARLQFAADVFGEDGVRAVLWHQGESDGVANTGIDAYATRLEAVIQGMRTHAGWAIPWGVARVAFLPSTTAEQFNAVNGGQNRVIENVPFVFAGPTTDDLVGEAWRYDEVHFNEAGLREHARRWVDAISLPECHGFEGVENTEECEESPSGNAEPADVGLPTSDAALDVGMIEDGTMSGPEDSGISKAQADGSMMASNPSPTNETGDAMVSSMDASIANVTEPSGDGSTGTQSGCHSFGSGTVSMARLCFFGVFLLGLVRRRTRP